MMLHYLNVGLPIAIMASAVAANSVALTLMLRHRRREKARAKLMGEKLRAFSDALVPLNDVLVCFLADCTIAEAGARVQSSALYDAFDGWCQQNGERCWSQKGFNKAMSASGFDKIIRDGVWWQGVSLALPKTDSAQ